jgi:hypothetical protein
MPEKGWYSLTVRANTARMVSELAKAKDLTVDEFLNELVATSGGCLTCSVFGAKIKPENMANHMAKVHSR